MPEDYDPNEIVLDEPENETSLLHLMEDVQEWTPPQTQQKELK